MRDNRSRGEARDGLEGIENSSRKAKRRRIEGVRERTCQKVNKRKSKSQWEQMSWKEEEDYIRRDIFYLFSASCCHSVLRSQTARVTFTAR